MAAMSQRMTQQLGPVEGVANLPAKRFIVHTRIVLRSSFEDTARPFALARFDSLRRLSRISSRKAAVALAWDLFRGYLILVRNLTIFVLALFEFGSLR
jgi:hypothetical protein